MNEGRSQGERSTLRTRKGSESDKWDVTPDGGSAGREGRQFAVANVGNNGRIYLRYGSFYKHLEYSHTPNSRGVMWGKLSSVIQPAFQQPLP
jgi:hypothetical protein